MYRKLLKLRKNQLLYLTKTFSNQTCANESVNSSETVAKIQQFVQEDLIEYKDPSMLEPCKEDISHVSTYLKPTFNFAAYVNKSETLQQLLKLGVNLHKIEQNAKAVPFILGLKFEDIKEHIIFLHNLGLTAETVGGIITKNPFILKEDINNLEIRVNYLKCKKFSDDMILYILSKNPFWLSYSTNEIDAKLGLFQKQFHLTGSEVRLVATSKPKLITYDFEKIKLNMFVVKEEMGFTSEEVKRIILKKPSIFLNGQDKLLKAFEYLHRDMAISLERILEEPEILTCRKTRIKERHAFLVELTRAQYDPKKPNYVSLKQLVSGSDSYFATEVAKSSVQTFNLFLKSL